MLSFRLWSRIANRFQRSSSVIVGHFATSRPVRKQPEQISDSSIPQWRTQGDGQGRVSCSLSFSIESRPIVSLNTTIGKDNLCLSCLNKALYDIRVSDNTSLWERILMWLCRGQPPPNRYPLTQPEVSTWGVIFAVVIVVATVALGWTCGSR